MMRDPWIPVALWLAFLIAIWTLCTLLQIGWRYLSTWDRVERSTRGDGTAAAARREPLSSMARAVREDRRPLDERVAADLAARGYSSFTLGEVRQFNHDERSDWPIPQSHVGAQSRSHGVEQGGVVRASEVGGSTRLTWTPPPDRAA